ncbi:hypothetical protein [Chelativorans sp. YIM 93263]|uniref:hypothetical protein n=1 Tax=Chelativorans sp. YIM 93263 TaxID=2906648 RepID=UPI002377FB58|nr:hypothetical protein [Chelativorans sp. YIM 93263]
MDFGRLISPAGCAGFGGALVALGLAVGSASAGGWFDETRYADSFGNLIIHSPSGYKRILVGREYRAQAYEQREAEDDRVAYVERRRGRIYLHERSHCPYGALVKGRSYMYGLPDGVVPVLTAPCRR